MSIDLYQIDAFTKEPFTGNPAAVCILDEAASDDWMQKVAREMNLSETAFLVKREELYDLRWFTPTTEVALCGHATLASAHALWESGRLAADETALFHTLSGQLKATRVEDKIELDFPLIRQQPALPPGNLVEALGVPRRSIVSIVACGVDYLVQVESEAAVRAAEPNFKLLLESPTQGVALTGTAESPGIDFVSRYFAPKAGINEDPVTGSTHCYLGPYWSRFLGKKKMTAYQASSRGGTLFIRVGKQRVYVAGHAVTVVQGKLLSTPT